MHVEIFEGGTALSPFEELLAIEAFKRLPNQVVQRPGDLLVYRRVWTGSGVYSYSSRFRDARHVTVALDQLSIEIDGVKVPGGATAMWLNNQDLLGIEIYTFSDDFPESSERVGIAASV